MSLNWSMRNGGAILARVLNFGLKLERTKIVSRLYNGAYHVQTVGNAAQYADVTIYVDSPLKRDAVTEAEAQANLLTIEYRDETYSGYIQDVVVWTPVRTGKSYTGTLRFILVVGE